MDLFFEIGSYVFTIILVLINLINIRKLYKVKHSSHLSVTAFWLLLLSMVYFTIYSIYYQILELVISYGIQALLLAIYVGQIYWYRSTCNNSTEELSEVVVEPQ